MKTILRKKLFITLMAGTISLHSLTGCSLKSDISNSNLAITTIDNNKENLSVGEKRVDIKVTIPTTYDYCSAYRTVDKIKELVATNNIGNIYLDIGLGEYPVGELRNDYIDCVIAIINKLSSNGIEFTLVGDDWQLEIFSQYRTMSICSKKGEIEEKVDKYGMVCYKDKIYYKKGFNIDIENDDSNFVEDKKYIIQEGDTLISIADKYGIDYEDLGRYNDIKDYSLIRIGDIIIIPNIYGDYIEELASEPTISKETEEPASESTISKETEEPSYAEVDRDEYYIGIDVSEHNGEIDWSAAAEKIDFAIVRVGDAAVKDENGNYLPDLYLFENLAGCQENDIPTGAYYFTRAHSKEEMEKEIAFVLNCLKDEDGNYLNLTRPIYIDVEEGCADELTESEESRKAQVERIIMFCEAMEEAGFATGVYINANYIDKLEELRDRYSIWGHGGDISGWLYHSDQSIDNPYYGYYGDEEDDFYTSSYVVNIVQSTSRGKAEFCSSENIDIDYARRDFFNALDELFEARRGTAMQKKNI